MKKLQQIKCSSHQKSVPILSLLLFWDTSNKRTLRSFSFYFKGKWWNIDEKRRRRIYSLLKKFENIHLKHRFYTTVSRRLRDGKVAEKHIHVLLFGNCWTHGEEVEEDDQIFYKKWRLENLKYCCTKYFGDKKEVDLNKRKALRDYINSSKLEQK